MVLGGGAFGGGALDFEGGALMNGVSASIKGILESFLPTSTTWGYSEKAALPHEPYLRKQPSPDTKSANTLILGF